MKEESKEIPRHSFTDDLRKVHSIPDPTVTSDIDLVWALSGRTSVLGTDVDKLKREIDPDDDWLRVQHAIKIADEINALRANKKVSELTNADRTVPILYNGRALHNKEFLEAMENGRKTTSYETEGPFENKRNRKITYPNVIVRDIPQDNTIGQVQSFRKFLKEDPNYKTIAVVSSAYHLARAARIFGHDSPQALTETTLYIPQYRKHSKARLITENMANELSNATFIFFGIDREYQRPGTHLDLLSEPVAMHTYSRTRTDAIGKEIKPSIAETLSSNTFLTDYDRAIERSFQLQLAEARMGLQVGIAGRTGHTR